jgi:hypothetical protein
LKLITLADPYRSPNPSCRSCATEALPVVPS